MVEVPILANSGQCAASSVVKESSSSAQATLPLAALGASENPAGSVIVSAAYLRRRGCRRALRLRHRESHVEPGHAVSRFRRRRRRQARAEGELIAAGGRGPVVLGLDRHPRVVLDRVAGCQRHAAGGRVLEIWGRRRGRFHRAVAPFRVRFACRPPPWCPPGTGSRRDWVRGNSPEMNFGRGDRRRSGRSAKLVASRP